ncbi:hypothetical protein [Ureaplasma ceti]|uniref:Uncharacterized protein n=1 Tax=Ureaplasma ceti TaxID=3119530 RepID=A0ABP9UCA4_9BACT
MKLSKKTKYWLIGSGVTIGVLGAIFIPLGTVYGTMTQSLPPWRLGPWKNVPSQITADKLMVCFPNKVIDSYEIPSMSESTTNYKQSLKNQAVLKDSLQEYISLQLYRFNTKNHQFKWDPAWLKNLVIQLTPNVEKQEYKLTLSLMSGPDLKLTTAKESLYITYLHHNKKVVYPSSQCFGLYNWNKH